MLEDLVYFGIDQLKLFKLIIEVGTSDLWYNLCPFWGH